MEGRQTLNPVQHAGPVRLGWLGVVRVSHRGSQFLSFDRKCATWLTGAGLKSGPLQTRDRKEEGERGESERKRERERAQPSPTQSNPVGSGMGEVDVSEFLQWKWHEIISRWGICRNSETQLKVENLSQRFVVGVIHRLFDRRESWRYIYG